MRTLGLMRAAICYWLVVKIPHAIWRRMFAAQLALLPYAGDWAYKDEGGRYDRSPK